jgi:hypothetical protein
MKLYRVENPGQWISYMKLTKRDVKLFRKKYTVSEATEDQRCAASLKWAMGYRK